MWQLIHFYLAVLSIVGHVSARESVPVLLWNAEVDGVKTTATNHIDARELVDRIYPLLEHSLVVLFVQDELSVEDFSLRPASLPNLQNLADRFSNGGLLFLPAVQSTAKLPKILESKGFKIIRMKAGEKTGDFERSSQTLVLVELPPTVSGDRTINLEKNDKIVSDMFTTFRNKRPDAVGLYTAKRASWNSAEGAKHRPQRHLLAKESTESGYESYQFYNRSGEVFVLFENSALLYPGNGNETAKDKQAVNLGMGKVVDGDSNVANSSAFITIDFPSPTNTASLPITSAVIKFMFTLSRTKYWNMEAAKLTTTMDGRRTTVNLTPVSMHTPYGFSYHCSRNTILKTDNNTEPMELVLQGVQIQPFRIEGDRFGDGYDCEGFFSVAIWAGIFIGFFIIAVLGWGLSMLSDIQTPDRFDDPKGKGITVTATD